MAALYVTHRLSHADEAQWQDYISAVPTFAAPTDSQKLDLAIAIAQEVIDAPDGVETLLEMLAATVNQSQAETIYQICADYIALHGRVSPEEMRFIDKLGETLRLDRLSRAALDRAAQARATHLADSLPDVPEEAAHE